MKYIDPFPVTCERCSGSSMQGVPDLLRLVATCPACGASFAEVGRQMREGADDWGEFCAVTEIVMKVEGMLGKAISDVELKGVRTLRDIARVVERHLPPASGSRSIELVQEAARQLPWCSAGEVLLDAPIMDAVHLCRWARTYGDRMSEPDPHTPSTSTKQTWTVYRQDDNGNRFIVQTGLGREEAERLVQVFEARGHKQLYWAEPE